MALIFLVIIAVLDLVLGLIVLSNNPKKTINRLFATFLSFAVLWTLGDALMLYSRSEVGTRLGVGLFSSAPMFMVLVIYYFALYFPDNRLMLKKKVFRIVPLVFPIILSFLMVFKTSIFLTLDISKTSFWTNQNAVETHFGYKIYATYFTVYFIAYCAVLFQKARINKANQSVRAQAQFFIVAISTTTMFAFIPNLILPAYFGITQYLWIGPLSAILFASLISYSIFKHRLFDMRLVVARTMAYLLTVAVVSTVYLLVVIGFGQLIIIGPKLTSLQRVFYVAVALLFAATLTPLKKRFDKITNRIFYRDAYDSQDVLDKISSIIVGSVDPHKVQQGALRVLSSALKPLFIKFLISDHLAKDLKGGDYIGSQWTPKDKGIIQSVLKTNGKGIIIYDELDPRKASLRRVLRDEDVSMVAPMVTRDEIVGYIIIGRKKSGNIYNSQDIGLLGLVSNELAVALQNAQRFEEIQAFNKTLQDKVTEATRELKSTNRKLVQLDEAKDEFISMASHQLRTPLTSIKGYLSMVVEGDLGDLKPNQAKVLSDAFGSSQRMAYLIADFLNVSRIKTGKFMIEKHEVDLPEMVQEEITQLEEMADSRGLKLNYEKPEMFPRVKLDENKTRQVMMNMVDNAIYYTPVGGTITIQLYATADEIVFKVIDTGIGVPKKEQHKLFTKFFRAGNAKKARPDGTGLGLFMAQKVVVEQGGVVIFESTEDIGSTFGFRFPLKKIKA